MNLSKPRLIVATAAPLKATPSAPVAPQTGAADVVIRIVSAESGMVEDFAHPHRTTKHGWPATKASSRVLSSLGMSNSSGQGEARRGGAPAVQDPGEVDVNAAASRQ